MTSGFRQENPLSTAKTTKSNKSSQIGFSWSAVGSVEANEVLLEVPKQKTPGLHRICAKPSRSEQKKHWIFAGVKQNPSHLCRI